MKTILLVAVEPLDHLARAFDAADFFVLVAADGLDAITLASERRPELVITNLTLPDMDGVALLERLEALPGCELLPGIVLVGGGVTELAEVARKCPRATVMQKPVDPVDLLVVVRALTGGAA